MLDVDKKLAWPKMHDYLVHVFFPAALRGEPWLAQALVRMNSTMQLEDLGGVCFTLPDLYLFLANELNQRSTPEGFLSFRRALYASRINAELTTIGAMVVVEGASSDPAQRRYRLKRLDA